MHKWQLGSLRMRFLLALGLWVALGIGGIWYSATALFAKHVAEQYHEELDVHIRELAGLVHVTPDGTVRLVRPLSDPRYLVPLSGFYWQVSADGGNELRSPSMTRGRLDEAAAHSHTIVHIGRPGPTGPAITYGFVGTTPRGTEIHYLIATDQRLLDETVAAFDHELVLWLVVLAAGLALTGLAILHFGFRPLDRLGVAVARLRSGNSASLEGDYPIEIAPLADDLNVFIAQNSATIERARVQAGNLAHGLRTPLAVITDEAERLAQHRETADSAAVLLEQARAMVQQIDYQLARARSSAGARIPGTVCPLPEVLLPILSAMRRLHSDRRFELVNDLPVGTTVSVDPVDFAELVSNLVDNAGKWARSITTIHIGRSAGATIVEIADDGCGMADEQLELAFNIGQRFDPDTPGSGLGLAIAREIAEGAGIAIHLGGRADGAAGLVARLTIPDSLIR